MQSETQSNRLGLDPTAVAIYTAAMDRVAAELDSAAQLVDAIPATDQLTADLGLLGRGFATEFAAAVTSHAGALSMGARLVSEYGRVLRDYSGVAETIDRDTAEAITRKAATL
ncbi:hypothetical protein AB0H00_29500 [Nocardia sp. NPDC023852]|uniref:hypothetical protein n=1 Tax=Nocardia sp. NPDC023852 TaxID=3154697 RepID=UPI0033D702E9